MDTRGNVPSMAVSAGRSLGAAFLEAAERHAARTALVTGDDALTYAQLAERAGRIAAVLHDADRAHPLLGAVFASRTAQTFAGVLGTLLSGAGYVPLNPKF